MITIFKMNVIASFSIKWDFSPKLSVSFFEKAPHAIITLSNTYFFPSETKTGLSDSNRISSMFFSNFPPFFLKSSKILIVSFLGFWHVLRRDNKRLHDKKV